VFPSAIFFEKRKRSIEMVDGHKWFYTVFMQLIKYIIIKPQTRFIGFFIIPIREYSWPRNRHSKNLKAHFCKQFDILFIIFIKIDGFMAWIIAIISFNRSSR